MALSSFDIARGSGLRESTAAMAPPLSVEERFRSLEARMTALEQLPSRMDRLDSRMDRLDSRMDRLESQIVQLRDEVRTGHVMIVTALTEQIEDSRRHTRVLFEEAVARIANTQERLGGVRPKKKR